MKTKEATEHPMILLRKIDNISFGIFNQIRVHDLYNCVKSGEWRFVLDTRL